MKKLWGRKISDLGFSQFMLILAHVAHMRGKQVVKIGVWEPPPVKHAPAVGIGNQSNCENVGSHVVLVV